MNPQIPQSKLTLERPDIWLRALGMATRLTGYSYPHKAPLPDGTILACGSGNYEPYPWVPPAPLTPEEKKEKEEREKQSRIERIRRDIDSNKDDLKNYRRNSKLKIIAPAYGDKSLEKWHDGIGIAERNIKDLNDELSRLALTVMVPEGAMEWLLHEVGHWVAASPEERLLPNYGYGTVLCPDDTVLTGTGADREWQSWAFEEIVLSPFGPSRSFAPPEHSGGVGFSKNQIPYGAMRHAQNRIATTRIDLEEWRGVYGEWIDWNQEAAR